MSKRWTAVSFAMGAFLVGWTFQMPAAWAGEYYSWVDENGTMVMTDDVSRMPQATRRSPVQVHRFAEVPTSPPRRTEAEPPIPDESTEGRPVAVDPRDLDLPPVLLDEPVNQVRVQYVWVPLLSPLVVGGNTVQGFWWHSGATSPVEAFKHFLARYSQLQNQWMPGAGVQYPPHYRGVYSGYGPSPSGNPVYDQVVRERQALEESIRLRHFPNSPGPGQPMPRGGGGGHHRTHSR